MWPNQEKWEQMDQERKALDGILAQLKEDMATVVGEAMLHHLQHGEWSATLEGPFTLKLNPVDRDAHDHLTEMLSILFDVGYQAQWFHVKCQDGHLEGDIHDGKLNLAYRMPFLGPVSKRQDDAETIRDLKSLKINFNLSEIVSTLLKNTLAHAEAERKRAQHRYDQIQNLLDSYSTVAQS